VADYPIPATPEALLRIPGDLLPELLDGYHGRVSVRRHDAWLAVRRSAYVGSGVDGGAAWFAVQNVRVDLGHPEARDHLIRYFLAEGGDLRMARDTPDGLTLWQSAAILAASAWLVAAGESPVRGYTLATTEEGRATALRYRYAVIDEDAITVPLPNGADLRVPAPEMTDE